MLTEKFDDYEKERKAKSIWKNELKNQYKKLIDRSNISGKTVF